MSTVIPRQNGLRCAPTLLVALIACGLGKTWARDYFDPSMLTQLGGEAGNVDLSQFETKGAVPEGVYLVDVFVNGTNVSTEKVTFKKNKQGEVVPQLTPAMLRRYGIDLSKLKVAAVPEDAPVESLQALLPSASSKFSVSQLRLDLSIPQLYIARQVGGYIDPALWDQGIPVVMFNYNLNGSKTWQDGTNMASGSQSQNLFVSTTGGANVGPWRLRTNWNFSDNKNNWSQGKTTTRNSQFSNTYLQRNVAALRSELTLGEINSGGDIFDSIPFRGVQMKSDDAMLPSSQRGFAPVVTGVAQSNALVTITQNGNVIYQSNVAPGPFRIDDLYQAGMAGDLVVTVTEADGSKHVSTQAYSSLPVMQRPGNYEYEASVGRYRNGGYTDGAQDPVFAMGTLVYGLPHYVTLYGGLMGANNYQSAVLGTGVSLGDLGALSFDATTARASLPNRTTAQGNSFRMKYSKSMLSTGSTVDLTSYRYSTSHYYTFSDVNSQGYSLRDDVGPWNSGRRRSSWQLGLSQTLGSLGSLYLRGTRDDYWGISGAQNTLSAGFSSNVHGINYNLNYSIDRRAGDGNWPVNRQVALNISVPLSLFTAAKSAQGVNVNYNINHSNNDGHTTHQVSGGGSLTDNLSWSLSQGWGNRGDGQSGSAALSYSAGSVNAGGGYNYGRNNRGVNGNLSGGVLMHQHGVVFSRSMGDTMALVSVPDVGGVTVSPGGGKTNSSGYALVPYMSMYQKSTVSLDPTTLPNDAEVMQNSMNLYPTRGAVVMAKFKPRIGQQILMTLLFNGKPVPFGAVATLEDDSTNSSIVGDAGVVYLSGMPEKGRLKVTWGNDVGRRCNVAFTLPPVPLAKDNGKDADGSVAVRQVNAVCQ